MAWKQCRPPRLAEWLLGRMVKTGEEFSAKGDFEEEFAAIAAESGRFRAAAWYWLQVLIYLPFFLKTSTYWSLVMFKNYLKVALRNLRKNKGYSIINIAGLAAGMGVCILIMLWVQDEISYDRFNTHADQIYRVCFSDLWSGNRVKFSSTPTGIGPSSVTPHPASAFPSFSYTSTTSWTTTPRRSSSIPSRHSFTSSE